MERVTSPVPARLLRRLLARAARATNTRLTSALEIAFAFVVGLLFSILVVGFWAVCATLGPLSLVAGPALVYRAFTAVPESLCREWDDGTCLVPMHSRGWHAVPGAIGLFALGIALTAIAFFIGRALWRKRDQLRPVWSLMYRVGRSQTEM